jgi:hypothetical protein
MAGACEDSDDESASQQACLVQPGRASQRLRIVAYTRAVPRQPTAAVLPFFRPSWKGCCPRPPSSEPVCPTSPMCTYVYAVRRLGDHAHGFPGFVLQGPAARPRPSTCFVARSWPCWGSRSASALPGHGRAGGVVCAFVRWRAWRGASEVSIQRESSLAGPVWTAWLDMSPGLVSFLGSWEKNAPWRRQARGSPPGNIPS